MSNPPRQTDDAAELLQSLTALTATAVGEPFFTTLVQALSSIVGVRYVMVSELVDGDPSKLRTLAAMRDGVLIDPITYEIAGSPCESAMTNGVTGCPEALGARFPDTSVPEELGAESYLGVRLESSDGRPLGVLCCLDDKPCPATPSVEHIFRICAARAAAELERLQVTRALTESEQRYRLLVEKANVVLWEADDPECWQHTYVSPQAADLLGYPLEDWFAPDFWARHVHPDDQATVADALQASWPGGVSEREFEYRMIAADGRTVWIQDLVTVVSSPDGRRQRGIMIDITERKRAEAELAAAERRYRDLVENAADMMYTLDTEGRLTYVSDTLTRNLGYSADELLGQSAQTIIDEADRERTEQAFTARVKGDAVPPYEFSLKSKDGRTIPIEINSSATYAPDGTCTGTQAILRDITRRRRSEAAIRESQERFDLVTRATRDTIYDWNCRTGRIWRNENYRKIYGADEWMGSDADFWGRHLHPDDRTRVIERLQTLMAGGGDRWTEAYRFRRADGEFAHVVDRGFILRDADGTPIRIIGAATDVTDHERNQRLMQAIVEATASAVSDAFFPSLVRVVARELRARFVMIAERIGSEGTRVRTLAVCDGDRIADDFEADLADTPCAPVIQGRASHHATDVSRDFPALAAMLDFEPASYCGMPILDAAGEVMGHLGIVDDRPMETDPSDLPILQIFVARAAAEMERQRSEQRTQLMIRELDHRVKNNLAVILSLAQQTGDGVSTLRDFMPAFTGRIQSLAIAHEMLAHSRWEGIALTAMARQMIEPFVRGGPERMLMSGPSLLLPTAIATSLCMVLHELATNAAKYGALSEDRGRVELGWSLVEPHALEVTWVEVDGPDVTAPREPGFGMRLIEGLVRRQMRGEVELVFDPAGVRCRMRVPYRLEAT